MLFFLTLVYISTNNHFSFAIKCFFGCISKIVLETANSKIPVENGSTKTTVNHKHKMLSKSPYRRLPNIGYKFLQTFHPQNEESLGIKFVFFDFYELKRENIISFIVQVWIISNLSGVTNSSKHSKFMLVSNNGNKFRIQLAKLPNYFSLPYH